MTTFAAYVDSGMLPNYVPDGGEIPEYNTFNAALWYVQAVAEYVSVTNDVATLRELFPVLGGSFARIAT